MFGVVLSMGRRIAANLWGTGRETNKDGSREYYGWFINGHKNGPGTLYYGCLDPTRRAFMQDNISGTFSNDELVGTATLHSSNGVVLKGPVQNQVFNGPVHVDIPPLHGAFAKTDTINYKDGLEDGTGQVTYSDGSRGEEVYDQGYLISATVYNGADSLQCEALAISRSSC
jgi:hypothetical protein